MSKELLGKKGWLDVSVKILYVKSIDVSKQTSERKKLVWEGTYKGTIMVSENKRKIFNIKRNVNKIK